MDKPQDQDNPTSPSSAGSDAGSGAGSSPGQHDSIIAGLEQRTGSSIRIQLIPSGDDRTPVVKVAGDGGTTLERATDGLIASRYRIEGEIARGGVGIVYKARDVDLGRDVALKILHDRFSDRSDILQRFIEEAQIGGQLQHPGIVPVYEIGVCGDKRPFIAMKLVKGETLAARLERREDPTQGRHRILGIFAQVCQTVAYGHARRVVHRDLKPSNVMVGAFGEVQIVDWGFAKVLGAGGIDDEAKSLKARSDQSLVETLRSQTRGKDIGSDSQVGSAIGTPAYMPPEQARGEVDDMDARSDVFALGALLCEILTGMPPYVKREQDDSDELLVQAAQCQLEDAEGRLRSCDTDPLLVQLCRDCLSPARQARPPDAAKVAERIEDYLTHVADRARAAEVSAASARVRARWSYALAASVLLTVVVAGGGWYYIQGEQERRLRQDRMDYNATSAVAVRLRHKAEQSKGDQLGLLEKALGEARRARERARTGNLGSETIAEADLLVQEIEEQRRIAARRQREAQLLMALVELRIPKDEDVRDITWTQRRLQSLDEGYARIFADFGVDVDRLSPKDAATRLSGTSNTEVAAALDHWSMVRRTRSNNEPQQASSPVVLRQKSQPKPPQIGDWRHVQRVARQLDPDDKWRNDLRDCLASTTRPDLATVQALRKAADFQHMPAVSVILLSAVLSAINDAEGSLDVLRTGQRYHPKDFDLNFKLGLFLERATPPRWAEAAQYYTAAMTLRPDMAVLALRLAFVTANTGDRKQSRAWLERAIELNPNLAEANSALGAELVRLGNMKDAIYYINKGVRIAPNHPVAHWRKGQVLEKQGKLDDAIKHFQKATELRRDFLPAEVGLGNALRKRGRSKDADKVFQGIALDQRKVKKLQSMGVTMVLDGREEQTEEGRAALQAMVRVISQFNPDRALAMANEIYDDRGYASAASMFRTAFRERPKLCVGENRYRAACAAAMAGCGKGRNPTFATPPMRPALREQARKWLLAALADPAVDPKQFRQWQSEARLAGVRDDRSLKKLPPEEAKAWRAFWQQVRKKTNQP